jgi:hypothetical protein
MIWEVKARVMENKKMISKVTRHGMLIIIIGNKNVKDNRRYSKILYQQVSKIMKLMKKMIS